jgi:hypothetical protein
MYDYDGMKHNDDERIDSGKRNMYEYMESVYVKKIKLLDMVEFYNKVFATFSPLAGGFSCLFLLYSSF